MEAEEREEDTGNRFSFRRWQKAKELRGRRLSCILVVFGCLSGIFDSNMVYGLRRAPSPPPRPPRSPISNRLGPAFHIEPPSKFLFSNDTGGILDCAAHGIPAPEITWQTDKGEVIPRSGAGPFRQILPHNHSLWLRPFPAHSYRTDVHAVGYQCVARSQSGAVVSRTARVRAVLRADLNVHVASTSTSPGNPALLRCEVSRAAREYVRVKEWTRDGAKVTLHDFRPVGHRASTGTPRHVILPNMDLVLLRVDLGDSLNSYRCVVRNKITGEETLSAAHNLQIQSSAIESPPQLLFRGLPGSSFDTATSGGVDPRTGWPYVEADLGRDAVIPCFTSGTPPPITSWFKESRHHLLEPLPANPRFNELAGAMMITAVRIGDLGSYRCVSRNPAGETSTTLHLILPKTKSVEAANGLEVKLDPELKVANLGSSAKFTCRIMDKSKSRTGDEARSFSVSKFNLSWLKDGRPVHKMPRVHATKFSPETSSSDKDGKAVMAEAELFVNNVQKEDSGAYQCVVGVAGEGGNGVSETQASAELRLGDASPLLHYTFIDQTLQPGPLVSLKCSASGNPTPNIKWMLDGFQLPNSERYLMGQYVTVHGDVISHLNISVSEVEDGGLYSCVAANRAGSATHSSRLNIYGPPIIRPFPASGLKAVEGRAFVVRCPVAGFPIEEVAWKKDHVPIISGPNIKVFSNGTLSMETVSKERDRGTYSCMARNSRGQRAEAATSVDVIVPPSIVPFPPSAQFEEGQRTRLLCGLARADPPVSFTWLKDGVEIRADASSSSRSLPFDVDAEGEQLVKITTNLDDFSSLLTFVNLRSAAHSGNYTCVAENAAGKAEYTARISVKVPPSWVLKPKDVDSIVGERVELLCQAKGSPEPTITWRMELASRPGEYRDIFPSYVATTSDVGVLGAIQPSPYDWQLCPHNGSLILAAASPEKSGRYLCHVTNGIGQELNQVVNFTVKAPPHIVSGGSSSASLEERENAATKFVSTSVGVRSTKLECEARGDRPITVTWTKNGINVLDHNARGRYSMETVTVSEGGTMKSILTIANVVKSDEDVYLCMMENPFGSDEREIALIVQEPPRPPRDLRASQISSTSAMLLFVSPDAFSSSSSPSSAVLFKRRGFPEQSRLPVTNFIVEVAPRNVPWGVSSALSLVQTVTSPSGGALGGGGVGRTISTTVDSLRPHVQYKARVAAENALGKGQPCEHILFWTQSAAPSGKPRLLRISSPHSDRLRVRWEDPDSDSWNGPIVAYKIGWRETSPQSASSSESPSGEGGRSGVSYNWTEVERHDATDLQLVLPALRAYTRYELLIQAVNDVGAGPTEMARARTSGDVPLTAPKGAKCRALSSTSLRVEWRAMGEPELRGPLMQYNIYYQRTASNRPQRASSGVDKQDWDAGKVSESASTSRLLENLLPGHNYSIFVSAQTRAGRGPFSRDAWVFCSTRDEVPAPPTSLKILPESEKSVIVAWPGPSDMVSTKKGRISHYTLYKRFRTSSDTKVKTHPTSIPASARHYEVQGVQRGVFYQFWLTATNGLGEGKPTSIRRYRVLSRDAWNDFRRERPPSLLSMNETVYVNRGETARLACKTFRSVDRGMKRVWRKEGTEDDLLGFSDRIWSLQDELRVRNAVLQDSGNYTCSVVNIRGEAEVTYELIVQDVPGLPRLEVKSVHADSFKVELDARAPGPRLPLLSCSVFYKQMYGILSEILVPGNHEGDISVGELECGRTYQVYARCANGLGMGAISQQISQRTLGEKPKVPAEASFVHPSNDSVRLDLFAWNAETCPVSYFVVDYRKRLDNHWTLVSNNLELRSRRFSIRHLRPETDYELRVRANNEAGSSERVFAFETVSRKAAGERERLGEGSSLDSRGEDGGEGGAGGGTVVVVLTIVGVLLSIAAIFSGVVMVKRRVERKGEFLQSEEHLASASAHDSMVGGKAAVDDYGFEIAPHHQRQQCRYPQKVHVAQHAQDTLPLPPPNLGDICGLEEDCPPMPEAIYAAPGDAASADMDTMGKIPQKAEDICPYATFPEVATTYPVSTSKSRGTVGSIRHLDMIVMHEHPTMLVSDANRDSSTSNQYKSVHRPKRRKKRLSRHHTLQKQHQQLEIAESDSDCLPSSRTESSNQLDLSHWDPSPKRHPPTKDISRIPTPRYKSRADIETTTSYSEDESASDTPADDAATPISEEEDRIFIKQDNGQFIAVRASQVLFQKSHLAALDPRHTGSRKKKAAPAVPNSGRPEFSECDGTTAAAASTNP